MNRKNITETGEYGEATFIGWFDLDAATTLANSVHGSPYTHYRDVLLTAGGKLVSEYSNNFNGQSPIYTACAAQEAVEFINSDGTGDGDEWADGKGAKAFAAAEIK